MSEVSSIGVWMLSMGLTALSAASARGLRERISARGRARRAADRTHLSSIAEVNPGKVVRISGRLSFAETPLEAPFSGRECAHFEASVATHGPQGYRPRASTKRTSSFYVRDESGQIFVDAQTSIIDVVHDHHWWSHEMDAEARFEIERYLYQNGPDWSRLLGKKDDLRYSEGALIEGDIVTVVGVATISRDPSQLYYRDGPQRLALVAPRRGSVFVSDGMHLH
jgi:hypothetical protein